MCVGVFLEVELLGDRLYATSALQDKTTVFHQMLVATSASTNNVQAVLLSHSPNNTWHLLDAPNLTGTVLYLLLLGIAGNSAALRQVLSCVWPFGSPHPPVAYSHVLAFTKSGQFVFFRIDLQNSLYSLEKNFVAVVACLYCRHTPLVCLWLVFSLCDVFGCPGALNCNKVNLSPLWLRLFIACWE